MHRAICRIKPLGENGQQFRDGVLWLTLFDIAGSSENKEIIFISNNTRDFANKDRNGLHADLARETDKEDLKIWYFKSIADFARDHAKKVEYIDEEWISTYVDFKRLEEMFDQKIQSELTKNKNLYSIYLDGNEDLMDYIQETSKSKVLSNTFFVNELSDGRILLNLKVLIEKEYEIEVERNRLRSSAEGTKFERLIQILNRMEADFGYSNTFENRYDLKLIAPMYIARFILTIKNKKIIDYEFADWEWG